MSSFNELDSHCPATRGMNDQGSPASNPLGDCPALGYSTYTNGQAQDNSNGQEEQSMLCYDNHAASECSGQSITATTTPTATTTATGHLINSHHTLQHHSNFGLQAGHMKGEEIYQPGHNSSSPSGHPQSGQHPHHHHLLSPATTPVDIIQTPSTTGFQGNLSQIIDNPAITSSSESTPPPPVPTALWSQHHRIQDNNQTLQIHPQVVTDAGNNNSINVMDSIGNGTVIIGSMHAPEMSNMITEISPPTPPSSESGMLTDLSTTGQQHQQLNESFCSFSTKFSPSEYGTESSNQSSSLDSYSNFHGYDPTGQTFHHHGNVLQQQPHQNDARYHYEQSYNQPEFYTNNMNSDTAMPPFQYQECGFNNGGGSDFHQQISLQQQQHQHQNFGENNPFSVLDFQGNRRHSSSSFAVGRNGKPKRKRVINKTQRSAANIRERKRMSTLNSAFEGLRDRVPTFTYEKKISRIETLKLAIEYIQFMSEMMGKGDEELVLLSKQLSVKSSVTGSLNTTL